MHAYVAFASDAGGQVSRQPRANMSENLKRERQWASFVVGGIPGYPRRSHSPQTPQPNPDVPALDPGSAPPEVG
jgi:hypothetical protein